jgi:hypothetical protein
MPGFEGFWFNYRTSSSETSFTQGNTVSLQKRSALRVREMTRFGAHWRRDLAGARIIFYSNTVWKWENGPDSEP